MVQQSSRQHSVQALNVERHDASSDDSSIRVQLSGAQTQIADLERKLSSAQFELREFRQVSI